MKIFDKNKKDICNFKFVLKVESKVKKKTEFKSI